MCLEQRLEMVKVVMRRLNVSSVQGLDGRVKPGHDKG
jgi:hypothetical protein